MIKKLIQKKFLVSLIQVLSLSLLAECVVDSNTDVPSARGINLLQFEVYRQAKGFSIVYSKYLRLQSNNPQHNLYLYPYKILLYRAF